MADNEDNDMIVVPSPAKTTRKSAGGFGESNDRDQEMERHGQRSPHNRGYDEAADGVAPPPEIERVVDE